MLTPPKPKHSLIWNVHKVTSQVMDSISGIWTDKGSLRSLLLSPQYVNEDHTSDISVGFTKGIIVHCWSEQDKKWCSGQPREVVNRAFPDISPVETCTKRGLITKKDGVTAYWLPVLSSISQCKMFTSMLWDAGLLGMLIHSTKSASTLQLESQVIRTSRTLPNGQESVMWSLLNLLLRYVANWFIKYHYEVRNIVTSARLTCS